jgi:hypothetical protein
VKSHNLPARGWLAFVTVLVLIAGHAGPMRLFTGAQRSLAFVVVVGLVLVKYAWWKYRR